MAQFNIDENGHCVIPIGTTEIGDLTAWPALKTVYLMAAAFDPLSIEIPDIISLDFLNSRQTATEIF